MYATVYKDAQHPEISEFIQLCMALAFVPEFEVATQFDACVAQLKDEDKRLFEGFILYFRETWVNGLFPVKLWNKYGQDYLHRTNNRVESWHSTLKQKLPSHPNIFILVNALKTMEAGTEITLLKPMQESLLQREEQNTSNLNRH